MGHGPELLIALHGFGDRGRLFADLEPALGGQFTIVAPDLPFHGETRWPHKSFTKADLLDCIGQILAQEQKTRFSLMGYSFGARLAIALTPELADRLDRLYLLAPEGFNTRGIAIATAVPLWLRRLLHRALEPPDWFLGSLRLGRKLGLLPPFTAGFLHANLSSPARRMRTFGCWYALDAFMIRPEQIRAVWLDTNLPVEVYIGSRDMIVPLKPLQQLVKGIPNARLQVLEGETHRLVGKRLGAALAAGGRP